MNLSQLTAVLHNNNVLNNESHKMSAVGVRMKLVSVVYIYIYSILLKRDYKVQLANNKIQMAWLTSWLVVG